MKYPTFIVMTAIMLLVWVNTLVLVAQLAVKKKNQEREKKKNTYSKYDTPAITTSKLAIQTASSALQGLHSAVLPLLPCFPSPPSPSNPALPRFPTADTTPLLPLTLSNTANRLNRIATSARNTAASAMRKIQVPAYCPLVVGVQDVEKRGVREDVKKVISMLDMGMDMLEVESMDMEGEVEEGMAMFFMVAVGDMDMVVCMSIFAVGVVWVWWACGWMFTGRLVGRIGRYKRLLW